MTLDELKDAGCLVLISSNGSGKRWVCTLGHYMSPEWPSVDGEGDTIEEAVGIATEKALAARKPEMAGMVGVLYVSV